MSIQFPIEVAQGKATRLCEKEEARWERKNMVCKEKDGA